MAQDSLADPRLPASTIFDRVAAYLGSLDSRGAQTAARSAGNALYAVKLRGAGDTDGVEAAWWIDLRGGPKRSLASGRGDKGPEDAKPAVILTLDDSDFAALVAGRSNAQKLFLKGKIKVKGDVMKAGKIEGVLRKAAAAAAAAGEAAPMKAKL